MAGGQIRPAAGEGAWPFVGRARECAWLQDRLRSGRGAVIVGPAGIGKSRLLAELVADVEVRTTDGAAAVIAHVTGTKRSIDTPFAAIADAIDLPADLWSYSTVWRRTVEAFIRPAERGATVLICVDDAQWLDAATAAWVLRLAANRSVLLAVSVRPQERTTDAITALWKDSYLDRLDLPALGELDISDLLAQVLGGRVAPRVAYEFSRRSSGVPLYLRELVSAARATGTLVTRDGVWTLAGELPVGTQLTELIGAKLRTLDPAGRRAVLLSAIAGPLRVDIADQLADLTVWSRLHRLAMIEIGVQDGHDVLLPAHPVYAEVAVELADPAELSTAKGALADAILRAHGPDALVGHELVRVAGWRMESGDGRAVGDASLLARAARFAGTAGDGRLADATEQFTDQAEALDYLQIRTMALLWHLDRAADAFQLLEDAVHWWSDADWYRSVEELRVSAATESGRFAEACALGGPALRRRTVGSAQWAALARDLAFARAMCGPAKKATTLFAEVWRHSTPLSATPDWSQLVAFVSSRIHAGADFDLVARTIGTARRAAHRTGNVEAIAVVSYLDGWLAAEGGAADRAEDLLRNALGHLELVDTRGFRALTLAELVKTAALRSDPVAARDAFRRLHSLLGNGRLRWNDEFRHAQAAARLAIVEGEPRRGARQALISAERLRNAPLLRARLLHEALRCGHDPGLIAAQLRPLANALDTALVSVCTRHADAVAASDADTLDTVATDFATLGHYALAAEVAGSATALHNAAGRGDAARLSRAAGHRWLSRCEGARIPELGGTEDVVTLSAREREILSLVASAHSNREIAARLQLSVRTVESHLYRVSRRSGVRRRADLAALLL